MNDDDKPYTILITPPNHQTIWFTTHSEYGLSIQPLAFGRTVQFENPYVEFFLECGETHSYVLADMYDLTETIRTEHIAILLLA